MNFHDHILIRNFIMLDRNYFQLMSLDHRKQYGFDIDAIDLDALTFTIDGQTIFHEMALRSESLEAVIKAFAKLNGQYLESLILRDKKK